MLRSFRAFIVVVIAAFMLSTDGLAAQGRGKSQVAKPAAAAVSGPKVNGSSTARPKGPAVKPAAPVSQRGSSASARSVKAPKSSSTKNATKSASGTATKNATKSSTRNVTTNSSAKTLTVPQRLARNSALSSKLSALLPPGTNLATASSGFKNLGQFVAAVHVSRNLGIPFDQLKALMTGPGAVSLGQAITQLKPGVQVNSEVERAQTATREDLKLENQKNDGR